GRCGGWLGPAYCPRTQHAAGSSEGARRGRGSGDQAFFFFAGAPAQAVALELDAMSVVNDTVQYRIAEGGIGNDVMPLRDGDLACDQERSFVVAIIDDLKEITTLLGGERLGSWAYVFKRRGWPAGLCRRAHVVYLVRRGWIYGRATMAGCGRR